MSILGVDIWGADVIESSQCNGDIDAIARPTGRAAYPLLNTGAPSSLLPVWLYTEENEPYYGDARHVLDYISKKFQALGLTPIMATELEFYLVDYTEGETPRPPIRPKSGLRLNKTSILSINDLLQFDEFLDEVYEQCKKLDIPVDAALAENGCGQFEINLLHVDEPLKAADDAIFKSCGRCYFVQTSRQSGSDSPQTHSHLYGKTFWPTIWQRLSCTLQLIR